MYDYEVDAWRELDRELEEERRGYKYRILICTLADDVWVSAKDTTYSYSELALREMVRISKSRNDWSDLKVQRKDDGVWKDYLTLDEYLEAVDDARYYEEVSRPYSGSCPWGAAGMKVSDFL